MKVRYATTGDVRAIADLGRRIHAETRFAAYDYSLIRVTESLRNIIDFGQNEKGTHCVLIAEDDAGEVAGLLIGMISKPLFSDQSVAGVLVYYVFKDKRMRGAGFKLLWSFRKWAEKCSAFEICVNIHNGAQIQRTDRFLTRLGFRHTGGNYSLQGKSERPYGVPAPYDD
ncbi:GNAT family N-acetyltransferase [Lacisediminimonas sp.]|uniref:GNAT family N-acetyltransferase n=1 Tax=Lacisediminimonas sp. TaxID=3060582 RepID=UPI00271E7618|nr:GNAT family N-acetyltransferase [Lacisediminimonas sp.]MDO8300721.1 GNAT family N-acetyltransferase [Lacisediminimonas sp.]MDO9216838.1 GNAT family N-acetyltransferase [Lacisediminimonas sp.]